MHTLVTLSARMARTQPITAAFAVARPSPARRVGDGLEGADELAAVVVAESSCFDPVPEHPATHATAKAAVRLHAVAADRFGIRIIACSPCDSSRAVHG
ncbi:hypothetical protein [Streptomyces sp. CA-111067]|uniref:hypothetical protein n=1 Tax=Streptomyces sp. CA-111067 TaxID=3240046 RepID=UPI003D95CC00